MVLLIFKFFQNEIWDLSWILNLGTVGSEKVKHVDKKFQKPYVPVYDKTKKEIISRSAGKSVDMADINHGHNIVK